MGKIVVLLALITGVIVFAMQYGADADGEKDSPTAAAAGEASDDASDAGKATVPQPQEKYGFAPLGE